MREQILAPMKRNDRADDFIPFIEKVARPGMKVVFMMPYPVDGLRWSGEEFGRKAIETGKRLASEYTWEANLKKAESRVLPAVKGLPNKGIDVAVKLYTGSTRRLVRDCVAQDDVHLIVTRVGMAQRIADLLNGSHSLLGVFKRPPLSPVLLIHPAMTA